MHPVPDLQVVRHHARVAAHALDGISLDLGGSQRHEREPCTSAEPTVASEVRCCSLVLGGGARVRGGDRHPDDVKGEGVRRQAAEQYVV